jgi:septum formation protein
MLPTPIGENYPLILASASPRRKALLRQIALPFRALASRVDEAPLEGDPAGRIRRLAESKARAVWARSDRHWVLGADTVVLLGNLALGKPRDHKEARSMLRILAGKEHYVITGFALLDPSGGVAHSEEVTTRVKVRGLSDQEIQAYIAIGEPFGKAGSYAIQGIGAFMIEGITGSYTNVVGLPICAVVQALIGAGALDHFPLRRSSPSGARFQRGSRRRPPRR